MGKNLIRFKGVDHKLPGHDTYQKIGVDGQTDDCRVDYGQGDPVVIAEPSQICTEFPDLLEKLAQSGGLVTSSMTSAESTTWRNGKWLAYEPRWRGFASRPGRGGQTVHPAEV